MKRRLTTVLLGLGLVIGTQAFGQTVIPPAVKSAAAITQPDQTAIKQFVQAQVAKLTAKDPTRQAEGRDALCNALSGDPVPSAAFNDAYAQAVSDGLMPLMNDPSIRVRLNAGIIAARVADRTNTIRLKDLAVKLVADKADPVALWGVKAHKALILVQLRIQPKADDPLIKGLVPSLKGRLVAEISQSAYDALGLDIVQQRKKLTPEMIKAVIPAMQDLLAARIALYQTGMPDVPIVDTLGTTFLVDRDVWNAQLPEQRTRSVQLIVDLLAMGGARAASLEKGDHKDEILKALQYVASAVRVIADTNNKPALASAAQPATKLDVSMDAAKITAICDELIVAIAAEVPGVTKPKVSLKPYTSGPTTSK